ncbi:uncharacterized protein [Dermacentor andersoni]|uniref:uncharacterized protein isoform X5 n=1 Tax=Dermacentor andersoni TaxID=34620 RepID=UPI002155791A|nr:uncharacterized protein LOC126540268 isoform X5 [Dermacentor andersoni]
MRQLKVGDTFDSFTEWKSTLDEFCKATEQGFKVYASKSVKSYNKKLEQSRLKCKTKLPAPETVDEKWQFTYVQYCCVLSRGKSKARDDPNGKIAYKKCNAALGIKFDKQNEKLVLIKVNLEHNHSDPPEAPDTNAVDSTNDLSQEGLTALQDSNLGDLEADGDGDAQIEADGEQGGEPESSSSDESDDDEDGMDPLHTGVGEEFRALSVRHARQLQLTLGGASGNGAATDSSLREATEIASLLRELEKLEEADADAAVSVIVGAGDAVTAVFFQTGAMRRSLRQFPELLLFDSGYTFAAMVTGPGGRPRFSLASWSGHDAAGLGCPFAFALVMRPVRLVVGLLMSVFTQANPVASQVRLLLLGKEQLKLQGLRNFFDQASTTLLCHYHVIRSLLGKMDQLKMPPSEQERVCRTLRAMLACLHERTYMDNLRRLLMAKGRFSNHFQHVWHEQRDLWAGFRRSGLVPWCAGVNDRVEALVQFQQAVCNQSRSLCEAVCNLAYGAHGVLAQTTTEAMLDEIREYHVQLLDYEARLIAACCDYAAVHVLVQIRISRSHKFSVLASGSQLVVNSIAGKGTLPLGGFACDCVFRQTYRLPCTHAFVVAHARNIEIPLDEVAQRWRRCGPFPIDLTAGGTGGASGEVSEGWAGEGQREYQERMSRARDLSEALCSVAAHSAPDGWHHMQAVLTQLYRTWARNPAARITLALEDGTPLPISPPPPLPGTTAALQHTGTTQLEKTEPPCSPGGLLNVPSGHHHHHHHHHQGGGDGGDGVTASGLGNIKMPDDAVFGFSGGIFKDGATEAAGNGTEHHHQHCVVSTVAGTTASTTSAPACEEAKLSAEEEVYRLHSGDLSCFTASIGGGNEGAQATGEQLGDLFGYGSDFAKGLQAEGRDSPVLLSIKDDELSDGSKEVARIKWDNEESYKLLDSIMEADASEKLDCVADEMMATDPTGQQLQASMESAARSLLEDIKASSEAPSQ